MADVKPKTTEPPLGDGAPVSATVSGRPPYRPGMTAATRSRVVNATGSLGPEGDHGR
jgi:hypothetical protein